MKKIILAIVIILVANSLSYSQLINIENNDTYSLLIFPKKEGICHLAPDYHANAYYKEGIPIWQLHDNEKVIASDIYDVLEDQELEIKIGRGAVDNASALLDRETKELFIVVNSSYLNEVRSLFEMDNLKRWAIYYVFAHEFAHHQNGHLTYNRRFSNYTKEIDADEEAGFLLAKLGISEEEIKLLENMFYNHPEDSNYPSPVNRGGALVEGWNRFYNQN